MADEGHPVRTVMRWVRWVLEPDRLPDAEPTTYAMQCAVCEKRSEPHVDFQEPKTWVLRHAGRNPSHHTYREIIVRPWHAWMTD
ncbi:hypothetical protein SSPIM334S_04758 [Streptomyces spiroverticillatus]|uniref:DUF7848 domain-containing protein n=1 Tax=Streptomyces finlayi TaxID=67296 RepID=UPI00167B3C5A|nr:hypothetical protein [Streptomyces finlayi]